MIEQIVVRPLEETDIPGVLDLRYRVLDEPKGMPRKTDPGKHDLDPTSINIAAFAGERVVSTVRFDQYGDLVDNTMLVRRMATDPECQGQGIGRQVMERGEAEAANRGIQRIILHARLGAVRFYEKLGYQQTGRSEWHDGDENPEMVKEL